MAPNTHAANATKCHMYGQFLHSTSDVESNVIYWVCFIVVLLNLVCAAVFYAKSRERTLNFELASHTTLWHPSRAHTHSLTKLLQKHTSAQRRSLWGSLFCSILMIPIIIIEALAGLSITFCHQEDLIMFYWGTFFLLSVGSLIATWGLYLSQRIENEPAWNVALGTPVLVFAAVGHWCCVLCKRGWLRVRRGEGEKERLREMEMERGELDGRRVVPRYLPYCRDCQGEGYLYMSSVSSQENQNLGP